MAGRESWNAASLKQAFQPREQPGLHKNTVGDPALRALGGDACMTCGYSVHAPNCSSAARSGGSELVKREYYGERRSDGMCDDCARARREMVTHCMCGRPTGC